MATILIVDDDIEIANLFRIFLTREGHTVVTASDGSICLNLMEQECPDLILLDIMMAPMDGWETLLAIKEKPQTKGIPVIMITGKPLADNEREKYQDLFYDYILKPVRRPELCRIVSEALKKSS